MFGLKFGPKKFLGIDIGTSCIRVLEMGQKRQQFQLDNYGEADTSFIQEKRFRARPGNISVSDKSIARAIQLIIKETEIQTKDVNFSIPDFASFYTTLEIPTMNDDEIPEAIKFEVRPYVPLPLSEITLDWIVTEGTPSKTPLKILVVAVPNKIVDQYQNIARLAGLKLKTLEPEVFALARAVVKQGELAKKEVIGLIDIGARSTTCSVIDNKVLKTSHSFNIAGNELTERLAKSLNIDYNKAREMRDKQGLDSSNETMKRVLTPLIDSILEDIKKVFRTYYKNEGKEIGKVVLTGGLALLPGLKKYFNQDLKKEIVIADPFSNVSYPPILKDTLRQKGPSYAVVVGLTLKGLK